MRRYLIADVHDTTSSKLCETITSHRGKKKRKYWKRRQFQKKGWNCPKTTRMGQIISNLYMYVFSFFATFAMMRCCSVTQHWWRNVTYISNGIASQLVYLFKLWIIVKVLYSSVSQNLRLFLFFKGSCTSVLIAPWYPD